MATLPFFFLPVPLESFTVFFHLHPRSNVGNFCWLYLQNASRICPLITCAATTLVQGTIISFQDYGNRLLTGLLAFSAFSLILLQFIFNIIVEWFCYCINQILLVSRSKFSNDFFFHSEKRPECLQYPLLLFH